MYFVDILIVKFLTGNRLLPQKYRFLTVFHRFFKDSKQKIAAY